MGTLDRMGEGEANILQSGHPVPGCDHVAKLILKDRYLRLDPEIDAWELDDTGHLGNLKALADRDFTHQSEAILSQTRKPAP